MYQLPITIIQQGMMESSIGQNAVAQENGINEISDISQTLIVSDLYPNPTSGEVTVAVEGEVQDVAVYNAAGQAVGGWGTLSKAPGRVTLDVGALPEGAYVVKVRTPAGTAVKKLLVSRR